jgi:prolyl 4-hydroxylase
MSIALTTTATGSKLHDPSNKYLEGLDPFYPPYILPNSPELKKWAEHNPGGWKKPVPSAPIQQFAAPEAHNAAALGDIERIEKVAKKNKADLKLKDKNGWQPIHEAARGGHTEVVKLLIQHGAEMNARTGRGGDGGSVLNIALDHLDEDHDLIQYLRSIGAQDYTDEL